MAKHNFTVRIDDDMRMWLKHEAEAQQRAVANFIYYVLTLYRENQINAKTHEDASSAE